MRVITNTDTVEFVDDSGDKLILLSSPRQKDIMACDEIETEDAFAQVEKLKKMGFDTDALVKNAEATAAADDEKAQAAAKVREFRLKALAVKLIIDGDAIGGAAIIDAYHDMDRASSEWVDAQVASVWESAQPSEASARR